jgi:tripartite-type tricarboxylate transporter receptor subunit TctC
LPAAEARANVRKTACAPGAVSAAIAGRNGMINSAACSALAGLAIAVLGYAAPVHAQTYPTKPITIVVPLAAGTGMDSVARLYGEQLQQALGKPVVIENRPGAALTLAPRRSHRRRPTATR